MVDLSPSKRFVSNPCLAGMIGGDGNFIKSLFGVYRLNIYMVIGRVICTFSTQYVFKYSLVTSKHLNKYYIE
jgi:hypothetical protein